MGNNILKQNLSRFHFPRDDFGATELQTGLSATVSPDTVCPNRGSNLKLDLSGMSIIRLIAETGGGNLEVVLMCNR